MSATAGAGRWDNAFGRPVENCHIPMGPPWQPWDLRGWWGDAYPYPYTPPPPVHTYNVTSTWRVEQQPIEPVEAMRPEDV